MGLIKLALNSAKSVLSDTWKDYFVCDALPSNVLMVKGTKKGNSGSNDVITNGSGIVVNEGQCAIVVDDGIIVECAAEPGNYTFDTTKSPSIFDGGIAGIKDVFLQMVERFTYGGVTNKSQYVYYINTKEIQMGGFKTAAFVPFKVSDPSIGLSNMQVGLRCSGEYSICITNPILFYKNVAGNSNSFQSSGIEGMMKSELLTALAPALAKLSEMGVTMYSDIPIHTFELRDALNEVLNKLWRENRGISVCTIGISEVVPREEDLLKIQNLQEGAVLRDPKAAAAHLAAAQAQAMRDAAKNTNGAANAFIGVNMSSQNSGAIEGLFKMANENEKVNTGGFCPYCGKALVSDAIFCSSCGKKIRE